ncbi:MULTISPECIES: molybdenum cofactor guanylyltransferase [unclassified Haladaptatus]|uniref:molybdenum cofactor guanylyltransferase n=1 Tax=unclassified Haladaptatus TaxID=2622732 RepID=UPI0023E7F0A6|nr:MULTISPECIES: molybdenum cofactor guanylyltransferase [unclassified Haladaptatus]
MKADTGRAGIVLAGGRSARFENQDKALASLLGKPLIWHVVEAVAPAVDEVVVNCRRAQREAIESALADHVVRFAVDRVPDRGPVAGIRTGLRATKAKYAAAVPCDMPFLSAGFLDFLFSRADTKTGTVTRFRDHITPFPAVVHVRAAESVCTEVVRERDGSLYDLVALLDPVVIPEREATAHAGRDAFTNVNTHADLRGAIARANRPNVPNR